MSGRWGLLLIGLAVVTAGEAEHGSVMKLMKAWQATGEVVGTAGVGL